MNQKIFYHDQCPSCGRPLQVGVEHFGQEVSCNHCHKTFCSSGSGNESDSELNQKINSLIGPETLPEEENSIRLAVCSE